MMGTTCALKVHILEGTDSGGGRIYACGRWARKSSAMPYVDRAKLTEHGNEVTCLACQRKYALVFAPCARLRGLREANCSRQG